MYRYIFFDLDGTLTDSKEGIFNCVRYALEKLDLPVPPEETLFKFIGPPLHDSYMRYCGMTQEAAVHAVELFRERYNPIGKFENAPAPGAAELCQRLKERGYVLALASSKPEEMCLAICDRFGFTPSMASVTGSAPGDDWEKADVIREAMRRLGLTEADESEGLDRPHMRLADNQIELLNAVREAAKKVVVLFHAGSAVEMPWLGKCDAMLHAALGGQAGASAMLSALTGKINPSGKLAETWPVHYEDTPSLHHFGGDGANVEYREGPFIGYRYFQTAGKPVLFPFGHGLSYTTFAYENLVADASGVTLTVSNTGKRAGAEVVQLYIRKVDSKLPMPVQELKGFCKVLLQPGESSEVRIPLDDKAFRCWNVKTDRWEIEGGEYEIRIGASSEDIRLTAALTVEGTNAPAPYDPAELPSYYSGDVQEVTRAEFEKLLGHAVPADKPVIGRNMTLGQLHHSRAPIGWIIGGVLNLLVKRAMKKGTADLNLLFVHNMPLRSIARMTGGMLSMGFVDGLVMELKGFWVIGLCRMGYEFVKNLILNAQQKKRLDK